MKTQARWSVLIGLLFVGACVGDDPNARLRAAIVELCELTVRCQAPSSQPPHHTLESCVEMTTLGLAAVHHVYGAPCIDSILDQMNCRLDHDCDLNPDLFCPDAGTECELRYPCQELVPAAERACGGFASGPDLGIGTEAR